VAPVAQEWDCFLWAADEWIVNYSLPYQPMVAVKLFSIGHAFELYVKAANAKQTGDVDGAVKFGHNIPKLWADCKRRDGAFLPQFELRPSVLARDLLDVNSYEQLTADDLRHFLENQEIYVIAKYLADLKYFGAPMKQVKGAYAIGMITLHPKWAELFRALRKYLGHPMGSKTDILRHYAERGGLPPSSTAFLQAILAP